MVTPVEPVNAEGERRIRADVDSPAWLCWEIDKQVRVQSSSISYRRKQTVYSPFSVSANTFLELEQRWIRYDHVFAVCWVYSKIIRKKIGNTSENPLTCSLYYTQHNKGDGSYSLILCHVKAFLHEILISKRHLIDRHTAIL